MAWVDLLIVAALMFTTVMGFRRGFVRQVVELIGLVFGVFLGLYLTSGLVADYSGPLAQFRFTSPMVFLIIVGVSLLVAQILGRVAGEIMQVSFFGWFDQAGGALAGLCKGALWLSILISVLTHLNISMGLQGQMADSTLVEPIARLLPAAFEVVKAYAPNLSLQEPFDSAIR